MFPVWLIIVLILVGVGGIVGGVLLVMKRNVSKAEEVKKMMKNEVKQNVKGKVQPVKAGKNPPKNAPKTGKLAAAAKNPPKNAQKPPKNQPQKAAKPPKKDKNRKRRENYYYEENIYDDVYF